MKPFRERNPVIVGAVSLAVVVLLVLAAFRAQDLPVIGGGDTYYAAFSESGGLKPNDEVRIAGVRVGKVDAVELDGDHVRVAFRIESDSGFGKQTSAAIKVKTLLGAMYLSLQPAGVRPARAGRRDPGRAHQLAVRRRRRLLGPRGDLPTRSTPTSWRVARHARRPDPQHARGVPRRAQRGLAALRQHRGPRRPDQHAAQEPRAGLDGPRRPRRGHRRPDEGLRRPLPRAGRAPGVGPQPAGVDERAVQGADRR